MRLDDSTYEYIKEEVTDLFVRYDVNCIPISGFEIATKMGMIPVPYSSLSTKKRDAAQNLSSDGFYFEPGDGKEYIYYNDAIGYERCNMTILHEIGHAVYGMWKGVRVGIIRTNGKIATVFPDSDQGLALKKRR